MPDTKFVPHGRKIKLYMALAGIPSVRQLAIKAGKDQKTVQKAVDGHSVNMETLASIAAALNVHPFDICDTDGFPSPHMDAPAFSAGI